MSANILDVLMGTTSVPTAPRRRVKVLRTSTTAAIERARAWRLANRDREREVKRADYLRNKAKKIARAKQWAKDNPALTLEIKRRSRQKRFLADPAYKAEQLAKLRKLNERRRTDPEYRRAQAAKTAAWKRKKRSSDPEWAAEQNAKRRAVRAAKKAAAMITEPKE